MSAPNWYLLPRKLAVGELRPGFRRAGYVRVMLFEAPPLAGPQRSDAVETAQ